MRQPAIQRLAPSLDDVRAILAIEATCFGDSALAPEEALRTLARPEHRLHVAWSADGLAVGFCSCFELGHPRALRLEIDLLAVLPNWQSQGIGSALVSCAVRDARMRGIRSVRAAVRVGNRASERVFTRAGLVPGRACELLLYAPAGHSPVAYLPSGWHDGILESTGVGAAAIRRRELPSVGRPVRYCLEDAEGRIRARARLVHVQTLSGSGLWIERLDASSCATVSLAARGLVESAKRWAIDQLGVLVPPRDNAADIALGLIGEGFERIGRYRLFRLAPVDPIQGD